MGRIFIRPHEKWRRRKEICADQQCARCAFCAAGKKDAPLWLTSSISNTDESALCLRSETIDIAIAQNGV